jgi:hypothetical protein
VRKERGQQLEQQPGKTKEMIGQAKRETGMK